MEKLFELLAVVGNIIIGILTYIIPSNPWDGLPSLIVYGINKPLWVGLFIIFSFIYLIFLEYLYCKIKK